MGAIQNSILRNCSKADYFAAKMTYCLCSEDFKDSKSLVEGSKFTRTNCCCLGPLNLLAISKSSFLVFEVSDFCSFITQAIRRYFEILGENSAEDYCPLIANLGRLNLQTTRLKCAY